jgi:hypothetical protein
MLRVTLATGAVQNVGLGPSRKRWSQCVDTITKLGDWIQVDALDKEGNVLMIVRNPDIELEQGYEPGGGSDVAHQVERLVAINLQAQDVALKRYDPMVSKILTAVDTMLGMVTDAMKVVTIQYREAMSLQAQSARAGAGAEDGYKPGDMSEALIFDMLKSELPTLVRDFMGRKGKDKPNGKSSTKPPIDVDAEQKPSS